MPANRWDNYFLNICYLSAQMSKDPSTQVGAVIVGPDRAIRATGFNGFPVCIHNYKDRYADRDTKLKLIVHAEMNAALAAARNGISIDCCTLYLLAKNSQNQIWGGPPCHRCLVELIQAGITSIISIPRKNAPSRWQESLDLSMQIIKEANIDYFETDFEL